MTTEQIQANREARLKQLTTQRNNLVAMLESCNELIVKFGKLGADASRLLQQKTELEAQWRTINAKMNVLERNQ